MEMKGKNIKNSRGKKIHFLQRCNDKILLTETMENNKNFKWQNKNKTTNIEICDLQKCVKCESETDISDIIGQSIQHA